MLGRRKGSLGAIGVPGEVAVELHAGKVKLTYQESYEAPSGVGGDSLEFAIPDALEVTVTSPSGEVLSIKGPGIGGMGSSMSRGKGWTRAVIGKVRVDTAGMLTIRATGDLSGAVEPQILIG